MNMSNIISRNTGVSLGLTILIIGTILGVAVAGANKLSDIQHKLEAVKGIPERMTAAETKIRALKQAAADGYTLTAASEDAFRFAIANPGVRVPDPRHPGDFIVVEAGNVTGGPTEYRAPSLSTP